jgi:hypothetical protein
MKLEGGYGTSSFGAVVTMSSAVRPRCEGVGVDVHVILERIFPEIIAWHAFSELKPILAPDADRMYARRRTDSL